MQTDSPQTYPAGESLHKKNIQKHKAAGTQTCNSCHFASRTTNPALVEQPNIWKLSMLFFLSEHLVKIKLAQVSAIKAKSGGKLNFEADKDVERRMLRVVKSSFWDYTDKLSNGWTECSQSTQ